MHTLVPIDIDVSPPAPARQYVGICFCVSFLFLDHSNFLRLSLLVRLAARTKMELEIYDIELFLFGHSLVS